MPENTTKIGNDFSDEVASILATKYSDVVREVRVGGKLADVVFSAESVIRKERYAVECKLYESKLSPKKINSIVSEYEPAMRKLEIAGLLIIVRHHVTPKAQESLPPWANVKTIDQLYEELLGVREYVDYLINDFEKSGLKKYYVPIEFEDNGDAYADVMDWVKDETRENGLAILGGYGTGKTSFSKFLASKLAKDYRKNSSGRIPIRIELGNFSTQQDLEGLFGKTFTSTFTATDFNFHRLVRLNEQGRLLFIFDGFDEMKFAISWDEFRYNFEQIARLLGERSKVILLGRPSALTSEAEYTFVYRTLSGFSKRWAKDNEDYIKRNIQAMSADQIADFLERYFEYVATTSPQNSKNKSFAAEDKVRQVLGIRERELLSRPVHIRMLCDVVIESQTAIDNINKYELYDRFIQEIYDRETLEKKTRNRMRAADRRRWSRGIAWWLWTQKRGQSTFSIAEFQESWSYFSERLGLSADNLNEGDIEREILVGTCLEKKDMERFFFPHRSFQEFLVADFLLNRDITDDDVVDVSMAASREVLEFIELHGADEFVSKLLPALEVSTSVPSRNLIDFLARNMPRDKVRDTKWRQLSGVLLSIASFKVTTSHLSNSPDRSLNAEFQTRIMAFSTNDYLFILAGVFLAAAPNLATFMNNNIGWIIVTLMKRLGLIDAAKALESVSRINVENAVLLQIARDLKFSKNAQGVITLSYDVARLFSSLFSKIWSNDPNSEIALRQDPSSVEVTLDLIKQTTGAISRSDRQLALRLLEREFKFEDLKVARGKGQGKKRTASRQAKPNRVFRNR